VIGAKEVIHFVVPREDFTIRMRINNFINDFLNKKAVQEIYI
jgi:hypothetical protein